MKIHSLILLIFLIISLPIRAEEPSDEEATILAECLDFLSSGNNQGHNPQCDSKTLEKLNKCRPEVCPDFLMSQMIERDPKSKIFDWGSSPDKICVTPTADSHFQNSQDLENYLKDKEPFSAIDTPLIADCLQYKVPIAINATSAPRLKNLLENKQKTFIAEYYLTQHRLESGLRHALWDITAIDHLIGEPILDDIDCKKKFQSTPSIISECESLKACPPPSTNLDQSVQNTMSVMPKIKAIDAEIDRLSKDLMFYNRRGSTPQSKKQELTDKIKTLKEHKASFYNLHPWMAGKKFQDEYNESLNKDQVTELIKKQLSNTREKLKEDSIDDMQQAISCIKHNKECKKVNFDRVMAKTPAVDIKNIFEQDNPNSSTTEVSNKNNTAVEYFKTAQCLQNQREEVSKANIQTGLLALDGITIAASVFSAGILVPIAGGVKAIRAAVTLSRISQADRVRKLSVLMGLDVALTTPYLAEAADQCGGHIEQLERAIANSENICTEMQIRSKHTSDLNSCVSSVLIASLPIILPAVTGVVVGARPVTRALRQRVAPRSKGATSPDTPAKPPNNVAKQADETPPPKTSSPEASSSAGAGTRAGILTRKSVDTSIPTSVGLGAGARAAFSAVQDSNSSTGDEGDLESAGKLEENDKDAKGNEDSDKASQNDDQKSDDTDKDSDDDDNDDDEDEDDDDDDDKKKAELDCSKYKGGTPQNRRERICFHFARAAQLDKEIQDIQQKTQQLSAFKAQVWNGIKENQVPPSFFTNNAFQQHVQQNKRATTDYLSSFRLMYDISRIQDQNLTANDRNRLRQIIQDTDQYMRAPNLDGYSHIQESVNILFNRLEMPTNNQSFRL